jgi:hypothetical protein
MGATVRLEDLYVNHQDQLKTESYANEAVKSELKRNIRNVAPNPGVKSLDVSHWARNLPQPVQDETSTNTRLNNIGTSSHAFFNDPMGNNIS